jgi:hypothetical protein
MTWLKYFGFWLRRLNNLNIIMMGFKVQLGKDIAICLLGHLYSYAISFSKTTLLPCSQDVKETT